MFNLMDNNILMLAGMLWLFLATVVGQDEDGNDIEVDIVQRHKWSGVD